MIPYGYAKIAFENADLYQIYPLNMVMFHSFVYVYQWAMLAFHVQCRVHPHFAMLSCGWLQNSSPVEDGGLSHCL